MSGANGAGPRISVITAVYNSAATLGDALDSVAGQAGADVEHVVIDGASTDGSTQLLQARRADFAVFVSERDSGIYDALNKGIARSSGEVVGFLHADDVFADAGVLGRVAREFQDPSVDAVYGDLVYVSARDTGKVVRRWTAQPFTPRRLGWGWMPPHPTLYVRRKWYDRLGGFDTRYRIAADYHFILRLFSQDGLRAAYVPEILVRMRLGGASNRSLASVLRKSREDYDALQRCEVGGVGALAWKNLSKLGQLF